MMNVLLIQFFDIKVKKACKYRTWYVAGFCGVFKTNSGVLFEEPNGEPEFKSAWKNTTLNL